MHLLGSGEYVGDSLLMQFIHLQRSLAENVAYVYAIILSFSSLPRHSESS